MSKLENPSFVITGDVHINGGRWGGVNPETGRSRAAEHTYGVWQSICKRAVEASATLIVCGDLFLDGHPRPEDVEMLADGIRLVSEAGLESVILRGNHDPRHLPLGQRHPLARYADLPGVVVMDTPMLHTLRSGVTVVGLPWPRVSDYFERGEDVGESVDDADTAVAERATERLRSLTDRAVDIGGPVIVIAHCTVDTATLGSGKRGSEVMLGKLFHEPVLPLSAFVDERVSHVALGHIHLRQQLAERVFYCGAPDIFDFGEEAQEKAFSLVTVDLDDPRAAANVEAIPTAARAFRTIDVGVGTTLDEINVEPGELVRIRLEAQATLPEQAIRRAVLEQEAEVVTVAIIPPAEREERRRSLKEEVGVLEGLSSWLADVSGEDADSHAAIIREAEALMAEAGSIEAGGEG